MVQINQMHSLANYCHYHIINININLKKFSMTKINSAQNDDCC